MGVKLFDLKTLESTANALGSKLLKVLIRQQKIISRELAEIIDNVN